MTNNIEATQSWRFFWAVTAMPKAVIAIGIALIVVFATFLPDLQKDTRSDAFIPADHPALQFRDRTTEIFGLRDPMVIAVINEGTAGIFNPHSLKLVEWLTRRIEEIEHIDPGRITSLATENDIIGTGDGMLVEAFFDEPPATQTEADKVRTAVMEFPLYLGSLVARDGTGTVIVAELLDQTKAQQVYEALLAIVDAAPAMDGEKIHVASEGAVAGYMGAYIDADALRLNPVAGLVIMLICFIAFRILRGTLLPNLVVAATATSALGLMAAADISFFVITNALPVVLIGIAVADSIHILSQYHEEIALNPEDEPRHITVRAMVHMWRPVTLTTLTTVAVAITTSFFASMTVLPALAKTFKPRFLTSPVKTTQRLDQPMTDPTEDSI